MKNNEYPDNPMFDELPQTEMGRIRRFARDLAHGAVMLGWGAGFSVQTSGGGTRWMSTDAGAFEIQPNATQYINTVWDREEPDPLLLVTLGYMHERGSGGPGQVNYAISSKAIDLLDAFIDALRVFISYKHNHASSAFVWLVAPETLKSKAVQEEIDWARNAEAKPRMCGVLHFEFEEDKANDTEKRYLEYLKDYQLIFTKGDEAKAYADAMNDILVALDMPTY